MTTCCQENRSRANVATTSSELETVAADTADKRFNSFLTADEAERIAVGYIPKNTEKTTKWAVRNFNEWREVRNLKFPNDPVPSDLLASTSADSTILCKWLSHFVAETRNGKGEEYTPATIHQLLASLLRHMRNHNPDTPNFMDKKNTQFQGLHGTHYWNFII